MYPFVRRARRNGPDSPAWALAIGAAAAKAAGSNVDVWARTMSPGLGTVVRTSFWEDLTAREGAFEALANDSDYRSLAEQAP